MVKLSTDCPQFDNDIAEVVRLFLDAEKLEAPREPMLDGDVFVSARLFKENHTWAAEAVCACAEAGERRGFSYRYESPLRGESALEQKRYQKRCVKIAVFRAMRLAFPEAFLPWGSLTGIRPTRLLHELKESLGAEEARRMMLESFDVSGEKLALAAEILSVQNEMPRLSSEKETGVYIGIPYCKTRCLYCSFPSEVRHAKTDMAAYLAALKRDIAFGARLLRETGRKVRSMYMGGGTPTVLTADELDGLLSFTLSAYGGYGLEFTVEAGRPDTIDREKLSVLKRSGVTRISINPQSMNDATLALIGRSHSAHEVERAFYEAREAGFSAINMDVIAGLPGESLGDFQNTLDAVERLNPENLTVHTLAIKRSSLLKDRLSLYPLASAEEADHMVDAGRALARRLSMRPYYMYRQKYMRGNLENVGYAKPLTECVYNVDMMEETASILSHGANAMTKRVFQGESRVERIPAPKDIKTYLDKLDALCEAKERLFFEERWPRLTSRP
ncbi:MAG: coproporphyrinogen dehydrogenase HemZ [Clostridiaceae bacterium]